MKRSIAAAAAVAVLYLAGSAAPAAVAPGTPLDAASPWPEMRHDLRNTGASSIAARYHGDRPWAFRTGRGIFSTPVIGADGTVYVGSGDTYFYALWPDGRLRWRIKTGGLIDAAGALSAFDPALRSAPLTFGSADEELYHVTTPARGQPRIVWTFRASVPPVKGQQVDWWEGNVAVGPSGDLYAGNTGGTAYAIRPDGRLLWTFTAGNSLWTTPAFEPDGSSFWGSLDLHVYRLGPSGVPQWQMFTPGYVISSPAIGSDGTVYVGSFDSRLYALDPNNGAVLWAFKTSDHIYSSPALGTEDAAPQAADTPRTSAIYFASTDGSVYALTPSGHELWSFDTGAPVRSSPVLGRAPGGKNGIVYVGSSNGELYALDARTGRLRWSYDTTPSDPYLAVRNNLNGSPALGRTGIYIAGEDGYVYYVPYDYCLHRRDPRCSTTPGPALARNVDRVFAVDVGGNTIPARTIEDASTATVINLRLVVRRNGRTINAAMLAPDTLVHATPSFPFTSEESGDGHFLYVIPDGLLKPRTTYRLRIAGAYTDNGTNMGNFNPNGRKAGSFSTTIIVNTAAPPGRNPLTIGRDRTSAITISRLSVPMPAFLSSVNQIGFDSYDWIASTIARTSRTILLWVIGAKPGPGGRELVDPASPFGFPLSGTYRGGALSLSSPNASLQFSFGAVPLRRFELRGTLGSSLRFTANANLFADTVCGTVPYYGPELLFVGICNPDGVLAASGTFMSNAYRGTASVRAAGVSAGPVTVNRPTATTAGSAQATLSGSRLPPARSHVGAILLTDAATGVPVALNYRPDTTLTTNRRDQITGVRLTIPAGTNLPARIRAYVILDAFPIGQTRC